MIERIFNDPLAWGILAGFAVLSFVISLIFIAIRMNRKSVAFGCRSAIRFAHISSISISR